MYLHSLLILSVSDRSITPELLINRAFAVANTIRLCEPLLSAQLIHQLPSSCPQFPLEQKNTMLLLLAQATSSNNLLASFLTKSVF